VLLIDVELLVVEVVVVGGGGELLTSIRLSM